MLGMPWVAVQYVSQNLLRQIGVRTAELFNETQWTVPSTAADTMLHTFLRSGFALATETDLVVSPSVQSRRGDNIEYYVNIPFIDRDIGAKGTFHCVACPDIAKGAVIPDLPANIQIYPAKRGGLTPLDRKTDADGQSRWHSAVPHDISSRNHREEHQNAEDFCRYISWKLSNAISKLEDLRVLRDKWAKSLGLDRKTRCGVYRGEPLFGINDSRDVSDEIVILVSYAVIEDMGGKVPRGMRIKTSNMARAMPKIGLDVEKVHIDWSC